MLTTFSVPFLSPLLDIKCSLYLRPIINITYKVVKSLSHKDMLLTYRRCLWCYYVLYIHTYVCIHSYIHTYTYMQTTHTYMRTYTHTRTVIDILYVCDFYTVVSNSLKKYKKPLPFLQLTEKTRLTLV